MTFSIVIPTYNGEHFIEQALLSALHQSRPADEIILSDDNSTDYTLTICEKYIDKIKIYRNSQGPSGFVNGWNNAVAKANSDYISILHQDDTLSPTFLEEAENAFLKYPYIKHLFVPCYYINERGEEIQQLNYCDNAIHLYTGKEYVKAYQTVGHPHIHRCPGVITHRDIFRICKYREEAGHIADDDFFYRVGQYTDVLGILKPLASYRIHKDSETGHLSNAMLVKKLVHDMTFQINNAKNNILFDEKDIYFLKYLKFKYAKRLIGYGIKQKKISLINYALKYLFQ